LCGKKLGLSELNALQEESAFKNKISATMKRCIKDEEHKGLDEQILRKKHEGVILSARLETLLAT
jgi:hypothetical protein